MVLTMHLAIKWGIQKYNSDMIYLKGITNDDQHNNFYETALLSGSWGCTIYAVALNSPYFSTTLQLGSSDKQLTLCIINFHSSKQACSPVFAAQYSAAQFHIGMFISDQQFLIPLLTNTKVILDSITSYGVLASGQRLMGMILSNDDHYTCMPQGLQFESLEVQRETFSEQTDGIFVEGDGSLVLHQLDSGTINIEQHKIYSNSMQSLNDICIQPSYQIQPIIPQILTRNIQLATNMEEKSFSYSGYHLVQVCIGTAIENTNAIMSFNLLNEIMDPNEPLIHETSIDSSNSIITIQDDSGVSGLFPFYIQIAVPGRNYVIYELFWQDFLNLTPPLIGSILNDVPIIIELDYGEIMYYEMNSIVPGAGGSDIGVSLYSSSGTLIPAIYARLEDNSALNSTINIVINGQSGYFIPMIVNQLKLVLTDSIQKYSYEIYVNMANDNPVLDLASLSFSAKIEEETVYKIGREEVIDSMNIGEFIFYFKKDTGDIPTFITFRKSNQFGGFYNFVINPINIEDVGIHLVTVTVSDLFQTSANSEEITIVISDRDRQSSFYSDLLTGQNITSKIVQNDTMNLTNPETLDLVQLIGQKVKFVNLGSALVFATYKDGIVTIDQSKVKWPLMTYLIKVTTESNQFYTLELKVGTIILPAIIDQEAPSKVKTSECGFSVQKVSMNQEIKIVFDCPVNQPILKDSFKLSVGESLIDKFTIFQGKSGQNILMQMDLPSEYIQRSRETKVEARIEFASNFDVYKIYKGQGYRAIKGYSKQFSLPKLQSNEEKELMEKASQSVAYFQTGLLTTSIVVNIFLAGFMQILWDIMDDMSFLMILSMMSIEIPGYSQQVQSIMLQFIYIDIMQTGSWLPQLLYPSYGEPDFEDEALNEYFELNGYQSIRSFINMGSSLLYLIGLIGFVVVERLIYCLTLKIPVLNSSMKTFAAKIYPSLPLRLFMSQFTPIALSVLINLTNMINQCRGTPLKPKELASAPLIIGPGFDPSRFR